MMTAKKTNNTDVKVMDATLEPKLEEKLSDFLAKPTHISYVLPSPYPRHDDRKEDECCHCEGQDRMRHWNQEEKEYWHHMMQHWN